MRSVDWSVAGSRVRSPNVAFRSEVVIFSATPLAGVVPALLHYRKHREFSVVQKRGNHRRKVGGDLITASPRKDVAWASSPCVFPEKCTDWKSMLRKDHSMKRVGDLWEKMISFPSLAQAADKARLRKRYRPDVQAFHYDLERNLWQLHAELATQTYQPSAYHTFLIHEPKQRVISAAPYRDRVVHHALTTTLETIFEPTFTHDSFACRRGKGTHAAVDQAQHYARRFPYVLKADVRKFFPSVDHQILLGLIERKIKDPQVLWLVRTLIASSEEPDDVTLWFPGDDLWTPSERPRGLPIGNQTSQFFANVYLNPLDHFARAQLHVGGYVRYADDFLIFSDDKRKLHNWREAVGEFLCGLRLKLHPHKSEYFPVSTGIPFLGYRVFPWRRLLAKRSIRRFRRRIADLQAAFAAGEIRLEEIRPHLMSWLGHARQGSSPTWQRALFATFRFQKGVDR